MLGCACKDSRTGWHKPSSLNARSTWRVAERATRSCDRAKACTVAVRRAVSAMAARNTAAVTASLIEIGSTLVQIYRCQVEFGRVGTKPVQIWPSWPEVGPVSVEIGPNAVQSGQTLPISGQTLPKSGRMRESRHRSGHGPDLAEIGRNRPNGGQILPEVGRLRPNFGRGRPRFGASWTVSNLSFSRSARRILHTTRNGFPNLAAKNLRASDTITWQGLACTSSRAGTAHCVCIAT